MMKKMSFFGLRLTIVFACILLLSIGGITQASAETFKIGAICAQTGPAAAFGVEVCEGKTTWVKGKNAAGGLKGMNVEIVTHDTETNTITAVNAYRRHLQDKDIRIIWMGTSSTSILAVKPSSRAIVKLSGRETEPMFPSRSTVGKSMAGSIPSVILASNS